MSRVVWVDCETTGLDPDRHEIWELALVGPDFTAEWQLPVDLATADPGALRVGGFYSRRSKHGRHVGPICRRWWNDTSGWLATEPRIAAATVAGRLDGAYLAGASVHFDAGFLSRWLRAHGQAPTWHHRHLDVGERVAALRGWEVPVGLKDSAMEVGVEFDEDRLHSALYDAQLARRTYEACLGIAEQLRSAA